MTATQPIADLRTAYEAQLQELRMKQATMGSQVPEYVGPQIARVERALADLGGAPSPVTNQELYTLMTAHFLRVEGDVYLLRRTVEELRRLLDQLLLALATGAPRPSRPRRINGQR